MTRLPLAAAALGALFAADAAAYPYTFEFEQSPPRPITADDCRDPDFLRGASDGQHDRCVQLLGEVLADDVEAAEAEGRLLSVPVARLGAERLEAEAIESLRIAPSPSSIRINWAHWSYERSGDRVASCDEFVYQTLHTWSRFYDRAQAAGDDARAVFELLYGDDDIALGTLHNDRSIYGSSPMKRRRGSSSMPLWDPLPVVPQIPDNTDTSTLLPKNDFFALTDDELRMIEDRDALLHLRLSLGRHYWRVRLRGPASAHLADRYPTLWQWHAQMAERVADTPDAELKVIARMRADFRGLLEARRALRREGHATWSADVRALDDAILDALSAADAIDCLDQDIRRYDPERGIYYPTRCDWAPDDVLPALTRQMLPHAEWWRETCEAHAPDPAVVADGYDYRTRQGLARQSGIDPYRDEYQLERYLHRRRDTIAFYLSQFDGDLVPHYRNVFGDTQGWGESRWARAQLERHLSFGLADRVVDHASDLNPNGTARLQGDAWVFGRRLRIFRAEAAFDIRRDRRVLDLEVAGHDYLDYGWEMAGGARGSLAHFDVVPPVGQTEHGAEGSACVGLDAAGVPFELCAGLSGRVGIEVSGRGHYRDVEFAARPFARVDAMGHAGPSLAGIGGGAYIEVNVLDVGLPMHLDTHASETRGVELAIDAGAALTLQSLAGEVGAYVEFPRVCVPFTDRCVGGRYSTSLFDWPAAFDEALTLFDHSWVADLDSWIAACDQPSLHCRD